MPNGFITYDQLLAIITLSMIIWRQSHKIALLIQDKLTQKPYREYANKKYLKEEEIKTNTFLKFNIKNTKNADI